VGINTAVIGIGNLLLMDEGVGVHAVKALEERFFFPREVKLIDGGTMGLDLLPYLEGKENLLLIDAVDFNAAPGTIRTIDGDNIKKFLDMKFSVHQIGLPDMLFAASLTGIAPPRICLVGIQPETIDTGIALSDTLKDNFEALIDTCVEKLRQWDLEVTEKNNVSGGTLEGRP
jgi:hydrogenase maturation protease